MCWVKNLHDADISVLCGMTVHSRKLTVVLASIFLLLLITGLGFVWDAFFYDSVFHQIILIHMIVNIVALVITLIGSFTWNPLILAGCFVYIQYIVLFLFFGIIFAIFAIIPASGFPAWCLKPWVANIDEILSREMQRLGFVIFSSLLSLIMFFATQIPATGMIAILKAFNDYRDNEKIMSTPSKLKHKLNGV